MKHSIPVPDHFWTTRGGRRVELQIHVIAAGLWRVTAHHDDQLPPGTAAGLESLILLLADFGQNQKAPLSAEQQAEVRRGFQAVWRDGDELATLMLDYLTRQVRP